MLEETFFVGSISISRMQVMRIKPIVYSDIETTPCVIEKGCDNCLEYANENNVRWIDPEQDGYIRECIRLCNVNTSRERSYEEIMRKKIGENENLKSRGEKQTIQCSNEK